MISTETVSVSSAGIATIPARSIPYRVQSIIARVDNSGGGTGAQLVVSVLAGSLTIAQIIAPAVTAGELDSRFGAPGLPNADSSFALPNGGLFVPLGSVLQISQDGSATLAFIVVTTTPDA